MSQTQIEKYAAPQAQISLADVDKFARAFYESGYFTDLKSHAQATVKVLAGREMGIEPFAAMAGIHIIKGKPSVGAGLMAQKVKESGKYDYRIRQHDATICEIEFFQRGESLGFSKFTIDQATRAGVQNLDKWAENMLFARAMSNGVKWYTPDVFTCSVYTPEEMGAVVNEEGEPVALPAVAAYDPMNHFSAQDKDNAELFQAVAEDAAESFPDINLTASTEDLRAVLQDLKDRQIKHPQKKALVEELTRRAKELKAAEAQAEATVPEVVEGASADRWNAIDSKAQQFPAYVKFLDACGARGLHFAQDSDILAFENAATDKTGFAIAADDLVETDWSEWAGMVANNELRWDG